MSLIDKLKQIVLDAANDIDEFFCPSEYGFEEKCNGCCGGRIAGFCRKCWLIAIEEAEQEEASADG